MRFYSKVWKMITKSFAIFKYEAMNHRSKCSVLFWTRFLFLELLSAETSSPDTKFNVLENLLYQVKNQKLLNIIIIGPDWWWLSLILKGKYLKFSKNILECIFDNCKTSIKYFYSRNKEKFLKITQNFFT